MHKQCQVELKSSYSELSPKSKQISKMAFEEAEKFKDKPFKCNEICITLYSFDIYLCIIFKMCVCKCIG